MVLCLLQHAEYRFLSSLNVLNVVQSGIMFCGISAGVLACTAGVSRVSAWAVYLAVLHAFCTFHSTVAFYFVFRHVHCWSGPVLWVAVLGNRVVGTLAKVLLSKQLG